ncbi:MAG: hypothetical protein ACOX3U_03990 [Christensenellales bacterium]|jgi:hypothetical protein
MKFIRAVVTNKYICIATLIISFAYSVYYLKFGDLLNSSLCSIGRREPERYRIWCAVTVIAVFFNVNRLYYLTRFKSAWGHVFLYFSLVFLLINYYTLYYWDDELIYNIHMTSSILSGAFCILSFMICIIKESFSSNLYLILMILFIMVTIISFAMITMLNFTACVFETIPLLMGYIILFIINTFTKRKKLKVE